MAEYKSNREYKASLFSSLFGEPKKMLELYNAVSGANYPPDTRIEDATLDDVLFMDRINDLAFVVEDKVVILVEHQSTVNVNMPLRFLLYLGRVLEKIMDSKLLYRYSLVKIPTPEFIVLYNGESELPDQTVLRLSDAYETASELIYPLELEVKVYNVNMGRNAALVRRSETLNGYVVFIDKVKRFTTAGFERSDAIAMSIRECIDDGVLADYLRNHGSEVQNMLIQEWDMGKALESRFVEGKEEGKEEGRAEGADRRNIEIVHLMLARGLKAPDISLLTGLTEEIVNKIAALPSDLGTDTVQ